jgi:subtilisin family serine protease
LRTILLILLLALPFTRALAALPVNPTATASDGTIIVKFERGSSGQAARRSVGAMGAASRHRFADGRTEVLQLPSVVPVGPGLRALRRIGGVSFAEPNFRRFASVVTPDDPLFALQWALEDGVSYSSADLNLRAAWDLDGDEAADHVGHPAVVVAVIDDAVDVDHEDLAPNIVAGYDFKNGDPDPSPDSGDEAHGTMVAGCVAARGDNGVGIAGIAWNVGLMPLKFAFDSASLLQALDYAQANGAKIINMSFGGPGFSQAEEERIRALAADDILVVASAGNNDSNIDRSVLAYPANYDASNVIAVAAADDGSYMTAFSQYGPISVDVIAPGAGIVTTAPGNSYTSAAPVSGTSFSAPYIAGLAALIRSHLASTFLETKNRIVSSGWVSSADHTVGRRPDAARALTMAAQPHLVIESVRLLDENRALEPGEQLDVEIVVRNDWLPASGLSAELAEQNGAVIFQDGSWFSDPVEVGDLGAGKTATLRFTLNVKESPVRTAHFRLSLYFSGGAVERHFYEEIRRLADGVQERDTIGDQWNGYDDFHAWHYDLQSVPAGTHTLIFETATPGNDLDLLAKFGSPPHYAITVGGNPEAAGYFCTSGTEADCQDPETSISGRIDGRESISIVDPLPGTYHLVAVNFDQTQFSYDIVGRLYEGDLRPDPFTFSPKDNVVPNSTVVSDEVTVTGITAESPLTVVNALASVNDTPFSPDDRMVRSGDRVRLAVAAAGAGWTKYAQMSVGGITGTFAVTSGAAAPPTPVPDSVGQANAGDGGGGGSFSAGMFVALMLLGKHRRTTTLRRAGAG